MSNKLRGFEKLSTKSQLSSITLPERSTKASAGYDFKASEDIIVPSIWKAVFKYALNYSRVKRNNGEFNKVLKRALTPTLVKTDIKAYMQPDEYLELANRSSNPMKNGLILSNGVGIIDSDYYNNESNEGHIQFQFINISLRDHRIQKGDKIGQGIFKKFLLADNDHATKERTGGFGSSGK